MFYKGCFRRLNTCTWHDWMVHQGDADVFHTYNPSRCTELSTDTVKTKVSNTGSFLCLLFLFTPKYSES